MPSDALDDAVEDFRRQRLSCSHTFDQRRALAAARPTQLQRRHLRLAYPGQIELGRT
jgi:hypothetical protein